MTGLWPSLVLVDCVWPQDKDKPLTGQTLARDNDKRHCYTLRTIGS